MAGARYIKSGLVSMSLGNLKLSADAAVFNLPAGKEYGACLVDCPGCYAKKAQLLYPQVLPSRLLNLKATKNESFVAHVVQLLTTYGVEYCRIHESGDFYSQEYADKWTKIAQLCPEIQFFCYTKSPYRPDADNINIVESYLPDGSMNYAKGDAFVQKVIDNPTVPVCTYKKGMKCIRDCALCLTQKYILFHQH
jgi:hypothetical protein